MKIFISYCWDDENIVIPIIDKLVRKYNLSENEYFVDRRINVLGDHYWKNIDKSIKESFGWVKIVYPFSRGSLLEFSSILNR